ncbi:hypothetical protein [Vibrio vulnificus YJ016]|uniref:Uncharacterized protein n=1 Tax=Vibrio vulnificus (strain YJ016) TaxID=196600 RepID=Q7MGM0_VIBVY|nr:hypothetical protein [Vibrio vulnificus YJ016]
MFYAKVNTQGEALMRKTPMKFEESGGDKYPYVAY